MSRPYTGESRDEWEHTTCPDDDRTPEPYDDGDAEVDRMLQMELEERINADAD